MCQVSIKPLVPVGEKSGTIFMDDFDLSGVSLTPSMPVLRANYLLWESDIVFATSDADLERLQERLFAVL